MKKKTIVHVVGARPNFIKLAPVYAAFKMYDHIHQIIVHTGQHFDYKMSEIFFQEFSIPEPDINLSLSGTSSLQQIGNGIIRLEAELPKFHPDLVIIYGDINATAFTSIVCAKLGIKLAHVEAGLRSFDKSMPEETNRIIADALSDYYFTPSRDANTHLTASGVSSEKIYFVGNVMIDTLINFLPQAGNATFPFELPSKYGLVTLHRPSNVDDETNLESILNYLVELSSLCPIVFPIHPRTRAKVPGRFFDLPDRFILTEPLGYLPFLKLQQQAHFIVTDSGGIQEESTYLGVPCFTLRNNTERPVTADIGTNVLVGTDINMLKQHLVDFFQGKRKQASIPELWDGKASDRIAKIISDLLEKQPDLTRQI